MKSIILIIPFIVIAAFAELPNSVKDKATDDNLTYLDGKVNNVLQRVGDFSSATSTATFNGWVDFGYERKESGSLGTGSTYSYSCPTGTKILGGGCETAGTDDLRRSYPSSDTAWTCLWNGTSGNKYVYAICARIK